MPAGAAVIRPPSAIERGRISIERSAVPVDDPPKILVGGVRARVVYAGPGRVAALVPPGLEGGPTAVGFDGADDAIGVVNIAPVFATGLHQVDNPVFDREGNLYVTFSGSRGQQVPVSIFRVRPNGSRETFSSGIVNPTSMAFGPDGRLYVSSRFEGTVYRVNADGDVQPFATDLGVACGLAFDADGTLFVGDRSGTIFRVQPNGQASTLASLPASIAAFHLALGPDGNLYVTGPTLSPYDVVYRIDRSGVVSVRYTGFGRPQGLAFDRAGALHVVEALAGVSGVYRLTESGSPELVLSGRGLVGAAFDAAGAMAVCSNDTAYRLLPS